MTIKILVKASNPLFYITKEKIPDSNTESFTRFRSDTDHPLLDPRQWTENHVAHWLQWAARSFPWTAFPKSISDEGKRHLRHGEGCFSARAPAFVGDILWEHLELLQKWFQAACTNQCVPELGAYIDYTQAPGVLPGEDRKPVPSCIDIECNVIALNSAIDEQ
ncbi:hypothetical protein NQ317_013178 [Molorchus minor]|uniref:PNT domain-containing protein n=1 Tax=Molorchus minor TaxID=1323400 RepID=A0ABQ9ITP8_9CUCU|nr:hypothetical protein NQ317_013178 [Molorchus minor]